MRHVHVAGGLRHLKGWRPSPPDHRDQLAPMALLSTPLPEAAGPRQWLPPIYDQGGEGSCTANAYCGTQLLLRAHLNMPPVELSRQFHYFTTRVLVEGVDPAEDSGAYIRDVYKAAAKFGTCREELWPYATDFTTRPDAAAFADAEQHQLLRYSRCPNLDAVRSMLALDYPVEFGFSVPENMTSRECAQSGLVLYPEDGEKIVGGHAVYAYWYDDAKIMPAEPEPGALLCANSWGVGWGLQGSFWLPYRFFDRGLASDAWAPRLPES